MLINKKKPTPWGSPTLDHLVALTASEENPIDPEEVKRILFSEKILVQAALRFGEEALERNKAYRHKNRQLVAWIRRLLDRYGPMLQEETIQALRRELAPHGYPEDADPVYANRRTYQNRIEFEKSLLGVDTDKRNLLLTEIVKNLENYLSPRLECAPGLPKPPEVRQWVRELILDAYPFHKATLRRADGTERPIPAEGWDWTKKPHALRNRGRKKS